MAQTPDRVLFELQRYERIKFHVLTVIQDLFPVGCSVKVGCVVGTVVGLSHGDVGHIKVEFENGNVWEKHIADCETLDDEVDSEPDSEGVPA